jgi:hypothetical protein
MPSYYDGKATSSLHHLLRLSKGRVCFCLFWWCSLIEVCMINEGSFFIQVGLRFSPHATSDVKYTSSAHYGPTLTLFGAVREATLPFRFSPRLWWSRPLPGQLQDRSTSFLLRPRLHSRRREAFAYSQLSLSLSLFVDPNIQFATQQQTSKKWEIFTEWRTMWLLAW